MGKIGVAVRGGRGGGAGIGMTLETSGLSGPHGDDAVVRALVFNQCGHP